MTIQFSDPNFSKELASPIEGDGIQLPFFAPIIWWKNGGKQFKQVGGVSYFGGWVCNQEEYEIACAEFLDPLANFQPATYTGRDGDFSVYESRMIAIAPIIIRKRWHEGRSHLQALCYAATSKEVDAKRQYVPWGPVILSAKGLQTQRFMGSMRGWETHTAEGRREHAPGMPAFAFWSIFGTFGETPEIEMVGGSGKQSPITPIQVWKPEITESNLVKFFIGDEVASAIMDYKNLAREWANDKRWKGEEATTESGAAEVYENEYAPKPPDNFPF